MSDRHGLMKILAAALLLCLAPAHSVLAQSGNQLAELEQRATLLSDTNEIMKLQRIYGYYLDRSDWDAVVDLLTDDATAEYGTSGVYVGKAHVRDLLYGIGYGKTGLKPQQIREHIQLQPVITIAADGRTAKGRWRVLALLGQYQEYARWQAGPYENEYRKEGGKWKISRIHWYETFTVPYEGGWKASMAVSNVADRKLPTPDRPTTFSYAPWPAVSLPPFHYTNPVIGPRPPRRSAAVRPVAVSPEAVAALASKVQRLEDERDIQILQRTYGYYVDKNLWTQIADLFTADGTLEIGGRGVFVGRQRVLQYLEWLGKPVNGRLYDHTQMQPVVHVSPDGSQAKGRWRALVFGGDLGRTSVFGDCIYENEYRKENGVWKISKLYSYFIMYTNMDKGWGVMGWPNTRPEKVLPPDLPPTVVYDMYPGVLTAPYHYANPVSGSPVYPASSVPVMNAQVQPTQQVFSQLTQRLDLLEAAQAVERLQNIYGYYVDKWQWNQAAALFAANGTSEVAQRGVYVGRKRIRQSFDLYGAQGLHQGEVNDHLLYQPVIHVAADGLSAKARLRSIDIEGKYGSAATLGGGIYENEYVKEQGVWKIRSEHLFTTFLADYAKGWSQGALPALSASTRVPPDRPPSLVYESFPTYYVQPFHYDNPVTGRQPVAP